MVLTIRLIDRFGTEQDFDHQVGQTSEATVILHDGKVFTIRHTMATRPENVARDRGRYVAYYTEETKVMENLK